MQRGADPGRRSVEDLLPLLPPPDEEIRPLARLGSAFLQLLLPSQDPGLVAFILRLRDHAFLLIKNREAGVSEDVVRVHFADAPGHFNGLVETAEVLQGSRYPLHG